MTKETVADMIRNAIARADADNARITYRFMELYHRAAAAGVKLAVVAYPTDAGDTPIEEFKIVGQHPADLECSLDIAEAYIIGLRWRNVPDQKESTTHAKTTRVQTPRKTRKAL